MKKQILLALMMMCATCAMAVKLPSSPYSSNGSLIPSSEGYSISNGTTFVNTAVVASDGGCIYDPATIGSNSLYTLCTSCCEPYFVECLMQGKGPAYCGEYVNLPCVNKCQEDSEALGDSPLDASVWMLLAMAVAYGAYAYYQKRQTA